MPQVNPMIVYPLSDHKNKWWAAICPRCNWRGLSRDCEGGQQIADTGDYSDPICPECYKKESFVVVEEDTNTAMRIDG